MPDQKFICILWQSQTFCARQKDDLHSVNFFFAGTKVLEEAINAVKFLGWLKKFGPAQNILGPVKGQGISRLKKRDDLKMAKVLGPDKIRGFSQEVLAL